MAGAAPCSTSVFDVVTLGAAELIATIDMQRLHHLSIWDALVVRAPFGGTGKPSDCFQSRHTAIPYPVQSASALVA